LYAVGYYLSLIREAPQNGALAATDDSFDLVTIAASQGNSLRLASSPNSVNVES
jgi:hypothetical protein